MFFFNDTPTTEIHIRPAYLGGRGKILPAAIPKAVDCNISAEVILLYARLRRPGPAAKGSGQSLNFRAVIVEAILHLDGNCPAERVEAEHRIVCLQGQSVDRHLRDEVPVDDITVSLVDARAVLIDRKALHRARHWRGGKPAIVEIKLEWIPRRIAKPNEREPSVHRLKKVRRFGRIKITRSHCAAAGRNLVGINP